MPKILSAPLPFSFGHIGRSLAMLDTLPENISKKVLISKNKAALLKGLNYDVLTTPDFSEKNILKDFTKNYNTIKKTIQDYAPDKIIIDNHPLALLAAFELKIKTEEIHTTLSVAGQVMLNKLPLPHEWLQFYVVIKNNFPYHFIRKFLKRKNKILIPSTLKIEGEKLPNSKFIGPQFWQGWRKFKVKFPDNGKKNIFLTFGSSKPPPKILAEIKSYCRENNHNLLHFSKMTNNRKVMKHSDVVICHGGHTTVLEALSLNKPVLCIPQNKDQEIVSSNINCLKHSKPFEPAL